MGFATFLISHISPAPPEGAGAGGRIAAETCYRRSLWAPFDQHMKETLTRLTPPRHAIQQPAVPLPLPTDRLPRLLAADGQEPAVRLAGHHRVRLLFLLELQVLRA